MNKMTYSKVATEMGVFTSSNRLRLMGGLKARV